MMICGYRSYLRGFCACIEWCSLCDTSVYTRASCHRIPICAHIYGRHLRATVYMGKEVNTNIYRPSLIAQLYVCIGKGRTLQILVRITTRRKLQVLIFLYIWNNFPEKPNSFIKHFFCIHQSPKLFSKKALRYADLMEPFLSWIHQYWYSWWDCWTTHQFIWIIPPTRFPHRMKGWLPPLRLHSHIVWCVPKHPWK